MNIQQWYPKDIFNQETLYERRKDYLLNVYRPSGLGWSVCHRGSDIEPLAPQVNKRRQLFRWHLAAILGLCYDSPEPGVTGTVFEDPTRQMVIQKR